MRRSRAWRPTQWSIPNAGRNIDQHFALRDVGLFDERYFAYCEEADLALRAAAAGWEVGLVRGAIIRNPDLGSRSAAVDYLQLRNTLLLVREHYGRYNAAIRFLLGVWHQQLQTHGCRLVAEWVCKRGRAQVGRLHLEERLRARDGLECDAHGGGEGLRSTGEIQVDVVRVDGEQGGTLGRLGAGEARHPAILPGIP